MATRYMVKGPLFETKKEIFMDDRMLPHPCFKCEARFPTGSKLLHHMREQHPSTTDHARPGRPLNATPDLAPSPPTSNGDSDRYRNTSATCPFCHIDCRTRKKLMKHLELEHRDDNDHEEEPQLKVIRITGDQPHKQKLLDQFQQQDSGVGGPFVTPTGQNETNMVQNLLKAIGTTEKAPADVKVESKPTTKLQYKCFWCDASYRKRGKLMDHIDNLHKHNKQAENKMSGSMDDLKPLNPQHMNAMSQKAAFERLGVGVPPFMPGLTFPQIPKQAILNAAPALPSLPPTANIKSKTGGPCSFKLSGSLTSKQKPCVQEVEKPGVCKFFLTKKENPLANIKANPVIGDIRASSVRRSSLPGLVDNSSPYGFPYGIIPPSTMATAIQRRYLMSMRAPMMSPTAFYAPRMPMMMPGSTDLFANPPPQIMDHHTQNSSQVQFFARMSAMAHSPLAIPKNPESPLDLTKSYL